MILKRRLSTFTLGFLAIYVPFETWWSWGDGLLDPFYVVDFIGMVLLLWGALHSRRRPGTPGILAAGWAWTGANFWRAFWDRVQAFGDGEPLDFGEFELCIVGSGVAIALVCLVLALRLCIRPAVKPDTTGV